MDVLKIESLAMFSSEKYMRVPIGDSKGLVRLLCFEPNQEVALHMHREADEFFCVVSGAGEFTKGKESLEIKLGNIVKAEAGVAHGWKNKSAKLILLSLLVPLASYELAEQAVNMEFV